MGAVEFANVTDISFEAAVLLDQFLADARDYISRIGSDMVTPTAEWIAQSDLGGWTPEVNRISGPDSNSAICLSGTAVRRHMLLRFCD